MNNGYSICFNEWALDKGIKDELGLLLIISSLCAEKGYCFASNKYFSELFNIAEETISRKIKKLEKKEYITIEYEYRGCEVTERRIRLTKISIDDYQNCKPTIDEYVKENNISVNNNNTTTNTNNNDLNYFNRRLYNYGINIYTYIEDNFGRTLSPIEYEQISEWEDDELTRYAIKQAVLGGKYNIKYIDRILQNYKKNSITSVQQAKDKEEEFKNNKNNGDSNEPKKYSDEWWDNLK